MGKKTKIDWADATWNPVTGCLHGCEYCYARRIADRFGGASEPYNNECCNECQWITEGTGDIHDLDKPIYDLDKGRNAPYPFDFDPTFHRYRLYEPKRWTKPRTIFVCSMADLFGEWVPDKWIEQVFEACDAAPRHRYLFLTKNPKRLVKMANAHCVREWNEENPDKPHPQTGEFENVLPLPVRKNWWFGSTLDNANARRFQGNFTWNSFTSIEPLTEYMDMGLGSFGSDRWTIIGAETGNRKGKIAPKREWVENIVEAAQITGVKVFMKESLRGLMGEDFRQELPWEAK